MVAKGNVKKLLLGIARGLGGQSSANLGAVVLCHHGIDRTGNPFTVTESAFKSQMTYLLENGASWMTVAELGRALTANSLPHRAVCVTFDDGLPSTFEPIQWLMRSGGKCTQFVVTSRVEAAGRSDPARSLDWSQLKTLAELGVEIGSHTRGHPDLRGVQPSQLRGELAGARAVIEERLGRAVESLAYPFGLLDARCLEAAREAGYLWACTTQHVHASPAFHPLAIPRFECLDRQELAELLEGRGWIFYGGLQTYFRLRNRVVLG